VKKILLYITSLISFSLANAQSSNATLGKDYKLNINADGSFGINKENLSAAYADNLNHHFLNQGGLWIYAEDLSGQPYTSVVHFRGKDSADFWPGPIDTLTGQTDPISKWNKVWEISKKEVASHRTSFADNNYETPASIASWPAKTDNGFANYLAPFADVNKNQIYDPENGDFPVIKGDNALYLIANDVASEHTASLGPEIGIELHIMPYTFDELPNTIYFDTYIILRKNKQYKNVKVGLFLGGECGNPNDNYGATLVDQNAVIIYNGDNFDDDNFGSKLPYTYGQFLNSEIKSSIIFTNTRNQYNGIPSKSNDYVNYFNTSWLDGNKTTYGQDGNSGNTDYPFLYPRSSDPIVSFWGEEDNTEPGTRNALAVANYDDLNRGDYIHLEYCVGANTTTSPSTLFDEIQNDLEKNKSLFRATTNTLNKADNFKISVYPNPNKGLFTIEMAGEYSIDITDCQGNTVYRELNIKKNKKECNIPLASGVYYLKLMTEKEIFTRPLIVTN
jgi:hypothetical protein